MQEEIWKDIPGWEGMYQASNTCLVRSVARRGPTSGRHRKSRVICQVIDKTGYKLVKLTNFYKTHTYRLHRIMGITFLPNPLNKPVINHIDGNKLNNDLSNLEWCTRGENVRHAYKTGLMKAPLGKRYTGQYKSILCLDLDGNELAIFKSATIAAKLLKVNRPMINRVLSNKLESAYGYKFKYADINDR